MEKTIHITRGPSIKSVPAKNEQIKKFEYMLVAKKSKAYIRDLVYTDSIITAVDKINHLIERLNNKTKQVWSLSNISLIED